MAEKVLIYYNGGDDFAGTFDNTNSEKREWKKWAKENNQIGYISGYRYFGGKSDSVMVFCQEKPSIFEIEKRRSNGLRNAKWNYIQETMKMNNVINAKQAKIIVKTIKEIDVIIWSLGPCETRTNLQNARYHLWKSLDLAGFNFDVEYNVVNVVVMK